MKGQVTTYHYDIHGELLIMNDEVYYAAEDFTGRIVEFSQMGLTLESEEGLITTCPGECVLLLDARPIEERITSSEPELEN